MILRSLLRRPGAVQSLAGTPAKCVSPLFLRSLHVVPSLVNHQELEKNGIPGLLSPKGFKIAYTDYQQLMVDELNAATSGTTLEGQTPKSLVIELARNPTTAYSFNVASMAYNNHFFFRGIATDPNVVSAPSTDLLAAINSSFSSLDTLREEFLATADAMFGPGFVWLVQLNDTARRPLRILPTYLAGSPLSGAHYRRQSHDLTTHNPDSYQELNPVGAFGSAARRGAEKREQKPLGGVDVVPLLCVNTWEHVWLHDYGVRGKMRFLEKWWEKINWNVVQEGATLQPSGQVKFNYGQAQNSFRA
ncbi:Fe superoxide dismutase-like protein [Westerdykella ornata]|uniref:Fe superoxide dismutase-like protein n=1 Tax=Westerdykella ornata TaxID=318751 RepID=A0A6A6JWT1_WESOR|nr:Fe superoxide dismutase-like protein [Westerdykella ornata]KAF2280867.1 Fe superoxide dismutase-like protein [Westerdykella ornata]